MSNKNKAKTGQPVPAKQRDRGMVADWEAIEAAAREQGHLSPTDIIAAVRAFERSGDGLRSTVYKMRKGEVVDESSIRRLAAALGVKWTTLLPASKPRFGAAKWILAGLVLAIGISVALAELGIVGNASETVESGAPQPADDNTEPADLAPAPAPVQSTELPSIAYSQPNGGKLGMELTQAVHAELLRSWPLRETPKHHRGKPRASCRCRLGAPGCHQEI